MSVNNKVLKNTGGKKYNKYRQNYRFLTKVKILMYEKEKRIVYYE